MVERVEQLCPMPEPLPVPRGVVVALMTVILGAGLARTVEGACAQLQDRPQLLNMFGCKAISVS